MDISLARGLWIGIAILLVILLSFLPIVIGRQNPWRRVMTFFGATCDFFCGLLCEPRSTLSHALQQFVRSLCSTLRAFKKKLGRFYARNIWPRVQTVTLSVLPLHGLGSRVAVHGQTLVPEKRCAFLDLPAELRFMVYRHFVLLFPYIRCNITNALKADPKYLDAMALTRTCRLLREEVAPLLFKSSKFETDAKYPFFRHLPRPIRHEMRNLSLSFRNSTDHVVIHHSLIQQLHEMHSLHKLIVTVPRRVLFDFDREFAHILRTFKLAHGPLHCLTVMVRISLPTPADEVELPQAMGRLVATVLPTFGVQPLVRGSVWIQNARKGSLRPATAWFGRMVGRDEPDREDLPEGAA